MESIDFKFKYVELCRPSKGKLFGMRGVVKDNDTAKKEQRRMYDDRWKFPMPRRGRNDGLSAGTWF